MNTLCQRTRPRRYTVVNTNIGSGDYDPAWFGRNVVRVPIPDHEPPSLRCIRNFIAYVDTMASGSRQAGHGGGGSGRAMVLHDKSGVGRVGVLACALLLHRQVVATAREALLLYLRQRTVLDEEGDRGGGGLEGCVRAFKGADGAEELVVTGVASRWITPSMCVCERESGCGCGWVWVVWIGGWVGLGFRV
jgi:hypothetical protein